MRPIPAPGGAADEVLSSAFDFEQEKPATWHTIKELGDKYWGDKEWDFDRYLSEAQALEEEGYLEMTDMRQPHHPRLWLFRITRAGIEYLTARNDVEPPAVSPIGPRSRISALAK